MKAHLLCAALCLIVTSTCSRAQNAIVAETDLKAAYLYHFIQFTAWPQTAFATTPALQLCVDADNTLLKAINALADKPLAGRAVTIQTETWSPRQLCHVLIVDRHNRHLLQHDALLQQPILTLSDDPDLAVDDTIIALRVQAGRVVFFINKTQAHTRGLEISSKLLRLAESVK